MICPRGDVNYDGATNATDARLIADYVVGNGSLPTPPSETQKFVYYHDDHLGSGNIITDRQGELVQHIEYTPYGETRHELNLGVSINYLYTGQEYDREIGIYYYNARYYDANLGRFLQSDSIIPGTADHQAYNRYSYVRNNPIMMNDPSGHFFKKIRNAISSAFDSIGNALSDAASTIRNAHSSGRKKIRKKMKEVDKKSARTIRKAIPREAMFYAPELDAHLTRLETGSHKKGWDQYRKTWENNWEAYAVMAVVVVASFFTGGAAAGAFGNTFWGAVAAGAAAGAVSGFVGGALITAVNGGTFNESVKAGFKGAYKGAAIGALTGGALYMFRSMGTSMSPIKRAPINAIDEVSLSEQYPNFAKLMESINSGEPLPTASLQIDGGGINATGNMLPKDLFPVQTNPVFNESVQSWNSEAIQNAPNLLPIPARLGPAQKLLLKAIKEGAKSQQNFNPNSPSVILPYQ